MIVTIDGPAGTGKSTTAKKLAKALQLSYFDTGALYRAMTWKVLQEGILPSEEEKVAACVAAFPFRVVREKGKERYFVGDEEVTQALRSPQVTAAVSQIAALSVVRQAAKPLQHAYGKKGRAVFDGRDLGTEIFPDADVKFFLIAREEVRAQRRFLELSVKFPRRAKALSQEQVAKDLRSRDHIDAQRSLAPLKQAPDAILIDTSDLTLDEVVARMESLCQKKQKRFSQGSFLYWLTIRLTRIFFKLLYRYRVFGVEHYPSGGGLIAANHASFYDPPAVAIACPEEIHFLARATLFRSWFGKFIRRLNSHPIHKEAGSLAVMKVICRLIDEGKKVIIFPEGTRSRNGRFGPLQRGIEFLFVKSQGAIVPVYVHGTYAVWNRQRKLPKLFGKVAIVFGSPICWADYAGQEKKKIGEAVSRDLEKRWHELKTWYEAGAIGHPP